MCRLAAAQQADMFEVEDIELCRTGSSYTIDTVRALKARGWPEVHWLIGADMLMTLPQWHQPDELLRETRLVIMARPGWTIDWTTLPPPYRFLSQQVVIAPLLQISATEVRRRLEHGQPIKFLTPESVDNYIQSNHLYV
jgi:nicotinate-nucleotide adenylyltransferase